MSGANNSTSQGQQAEQLAAQFLEQHGLRILMRNFRKRDGEIDLICQDGSTLVFVEVRLRRPNLFADAASSITSIKQRRIIRAAQHYLADPKHKAAHRPCRFDCVLLQQLDRRSIEWVKNAFSADT